MEFRRLLRGRSWRRSRLRDRRACGV